MVEQSCRKGGEMANINGVSFFFSVSLSPAHVEISLEKFQTNENISLKLAI